MCTDKKSFRVVITGKGGVGKTTLTSCLATVLSQDGINVLAVDEDPQMNLPYALGLGVERAAQIIPLNLNSDYIEEKTGINPKKNSWGSMFKLNPDVDDVVERFGMKVADNLNLLVMGTVKQAGGGCLCAENVLLDSTIRHLALRDNEGILLDTQAGVEHFGRALSRGFSHCLIVSDDTFNALTVACHSAELARQIGIPNVCLVVNRASGRTADKLARFEKETGTPLSNLFETLYQLPLEPLLADLEPEVTKIMENSESLYSTSVAALASRLCTSHCSCSAPAA
ncbi:MAG: carbon monoxide dehydrogenase [Deltaproteobacteria bacterium]|nr:carbon monoxide dehydrogenase [Deltaproteobacteria bacterium]